MEPSPIYCNKWLTIVGIIVIHAAIWLLWRLLKAISPGIPDGGYKGFYLVLMPLGFLVMWTWGDPMVLIALAGAVSGLIIFARSIRRMV